MAEREMNDELSRFIELGIFRIGSSNAIFMDPVRVLSASYSRFRVSPHAYYSRSFESKPGGETAVSVNPRKRKLKQRKSYSLNERELIADQRHQEARPLLLGAYEAFLETVGLLSFLPNIKDDPHYSVENEHLVTSVGREIGQSLFELGSVWQAPLYEISLHFRPQNRLAEDGGSPIVQHGETEVVPVFNNLVINETSEDVEAEFLDSLYIIPRESCFHMSDLKQIQNLIPAQCGQGFNLIVIDPPWENRSAHQKSVYPTLPNRYFLSIPMKQLIHTEGALVALWVTNKEKLRVFVEKELFPMWGVRYTAIFYWLKVKVDGSLISDLDLFHHRPYECLLLGYSDREGVDTDHHSTFKPIHGNQVIISIPGDYSRKPPIGKLLLDYVPGPKPARCIELFARELLDGWTSWGNEPLHFQESRYFLRKKMEE
ncbi:methyltransferase-like protein 2 isoform X2 [Telopea speciosissima]|uniref:methyltransferase-like protein 2 isoform X2 n=1 Tax=Telopea speciosissima TaxID=54955 RepID=UPI001CC6E716|nr:methyltransferase-like protein 2 isoform X2 [Telopea speciosissima]